MSHFATNLAALAPHFPALAALLNETPIPADFLPTPGTDGTPTFSRTTTHPSSLLAHHSAKRRDWLGSTSMPAASAAPITASLDAASNGASGLGLSIATGYEWAAFASRLAPPQLVYVYEPDAALLRMALEICDLSALLADRRLVLLTGTADAAAQSLAAFLAANLGFDPPSVLHPLPTLIGERRGQLLTAGESIVRHAVIERQSAVALIANRLAASVPQIENQQSKIKNSLLALLLTPRYPAERPIQHAAALRHAHCLAIDRHNSASLALRLTTLADLLSQGPVRILSDLFRDQLQPLPAQVPVETWIPPLIGPAFWDRLPAAATFSPHDRIIVNAPYHARLLQSRGIPQSQIDLRPLAWPSQDPSLITHHSSLTLRHRIALIADLPATDAATLGIELPTHQAVFAAARDIIQADYLTVYPALAPDILRRALLRAGVDPNADDPAFKDPMSRVITHLLIPALPPLKLAATLAADGVALTLLGDWPNLHLPPGTDVRYVPFESYAPADWNDVAVLAHLSPQGIYSPLLLDAINSHVPIASPTPPNPAEAALHALLQPELDFAEPPARNYLPTLKSLLRDAPRRQKLAAAAYAKLATNKHE